jgi:hypothetical protein
LNLSSDRVRNILAGQTVRIDRLEIIRQRRILPQLAQDLVPTGVEYLRVLDHFIDLLLQRARSSAPQLPKIETAVEHRGRIHPAHGAAEADRARPRIGATAREVVAGHTGHAVVLGEAHVLEQLSAERDFARFELEISRQGPDRLVKFDRLTQHRGQDSGAADEGKNYADYIHGDNSVSGMCISARAANA